MVRLVMQIFVPELIRKKRDGKKLDPNEIVSLIEGYTDGSIPDYQMSAMLMAIVFRGFDDVELSAWTDAMLHSGEVLAFDMINARKVDKHSTGGVGDKISICLAPAVAALGVPVPMMSGRGLGHTGGTLDKLESIRGFNVRQSPKSAAKLLEKHGVFLIGQTEDLAPADRKLYALRDVTGTVESIPLIASSIMSKKLAEGIDALVLDVKVGKGAFMASLGEAKKLASTMIAIGERAGKTVRALLTNMDEPLGYAVGNALEVAEAIDVMRGEGPEDVTELTVELGAEMAVLGGRAKDVEEGRNAVRKALDDGRALQKFIDIVKAQGGDPSVIEDTSKLPRAPEQTAVVAMNDGYVIAVDPRKVARAALAVGAGRAVKEADVNPATGIVLLSKVGDDVQEGQPLAVIYHDNAGDDEALGLMAGAFKIGRKKPFKAPMIIDRM